MTHETLYKTGRRCSLVPLGLLLILTSAYADEEHADLSLTVAVPIHNGERTIQVGSQALRFQVIIENLSPHPVNLWRERYSWGYYNLQFQITDEKGVTWIATKKEKEWNKNFPDFGSIDPRGKRVMDVTFSPDIWKNLPRADAEKPMTISMIAIYESEDSEDARKRGVWSGRLVSDKSEYTLLRPSD